MRKNKEQNQEEQCPLRVEASLHQGGESRSQSNQEAGRPGSGSWPHVQWGGVTWLKVTAPQLSSWMNGWPKQVWE